MPIIQKIKANKCQIAIWDINESLNKLIQLSNNITVPNFKSKKKQTEFLSTRLLLNELLIDDMISYNAINTKTSKNGNHYTNVSGVQVVNGQQVQPAPQQTYWFPRLSRARVTRLVMRV